jgi:hypothetical protein
MSSSPANVAALIAGAVLNKYDATPESSVTQIITKLLDEIASEDESQLRARLKPIQTPADDVTNQVIVLALIDRFWACPPALDRPLTLLNHCFFQDAAGEPVFRTTDSVADFGGEVPTRKEEALPRLDELERLCTQAIGQLIDAPLRVQLALIAYVVGAVTRIHPFADGNGRTARLFIFYALTCWGLPLFPIPKVRNDPIWRHAMNNAIKGSLNRMIEYLHTRAAAAIEQARKISE